MEPVKLFHFLETCVTTDENKIFLQLEKFWYNEVAAKDTHFSEDIKRETMPLTLSVKEDEKNAIKKFLQKYDLHFHDAHDTLAVEISTHHRQPTKVFFSLKSFSHLTEHIFLQDGCIEVKENATVKDYLQASGIVARYPQLSFKLPHKKNTTGALGIQPSTRRRAFKNIIQGRRPSKALYFLDDCGLLEIYLPEVTAGRNLSQNRFHAHDIFVHLLNSLDGAMDLNEPVRWAALLHDVGKVPTRVVTQTGEASFHSHEIFSARMVVPIMKRLAVPIQIGQKVKFLVRNHMFHYTDEWTDKAVRRFVKKVPLEELQNLISLRLADRKGSGKKSAFPRALQNLILHIDEIIAKEKEFKIKDLAIDGHTLMELGIKPSRAMGDMLKYLFGEVKAERLPNEKEALREAVKLQLEKKTHDA
ncbi:MAG: Multifunctional CCA protein [Turneriella sp.]|nr:Multifunctional CCA protein [Turneriella sp.]